MADIDIRLLGPMRVAANGTELDLPRSRKARALLAMLALEPWEHARASLCAHIWPETGDPRADLRWALSKLRGVLGPDAIVTSANGIRLDTTRVTTDVRRLNDLVEQDAGAVLLEEIDRAHITSEALADLDGRHGVEFELWLESQRQSLRRLQQRVLALLVAWLSETPSEAIEPARQRVALDPLNEEAALDLLRLTLATAGRRRAREVLEQCRDRFRDAGLADAALLAGWRRLTHDAAVVPVVGPIAGPDPVHTPPQKPSLAVLELESLGGPDEALLARGITVDVTASLARLRGLFVIARASAARFRLADSPAAEIGARLGVRYLVHGSVRRSGSRLRVTVDLVECPGGEQIWSERFERAVDDLFVVQDEMVDAIAAALVPQIEQAERQRVRLLPTENLSAWECFHRAMWHAFRFTSADTTEAQRLLMRALDEDPGFARAHAGLSFAHFSRAFLHACDDVEAEVAAALEHGRESVGLEPRDAFGHWSLGRALFLDGAHDQALSAIDRALAANPNYAQGHYARGFVGCHSGLAGEVCGDLDMAQRLSPFDPLLFAIESSRAIALAVSGRIEEAVPWALKATQEPNAHFHIHAIAGACLQLDGRDREAARSIAEARRMQPGYSVHQFQRSFPHKTAHGGRIMREALLAAGLPER